MPAKPLLVSAMNPCPCGYHGDAKRMCRCGFEQVQRYRSRISGPVIDRFDLHLGLSAVPVSALSEARRGEPSQVVRARVAQARACAAQRRACNEDDPQRALDAEAHGLLLQSIDRLGLSLRAYAKVLRVSRTLADLEGSDAVRRRHVAEAVQYRRLDRAPHTGSDFSEFAAESGKH